MVDDSNAEIAKMSFEDALRELETIVRRLEEGETTLEDSIAAYERGAKLKKHCESKLADARARVEKITLSADGAVSSEPVDTE